MHLVALVPVTLGPAPLFTESDILFYAGMASFVAVVIAAGWGRRRWLLPYEVHSNSRLFGVLEGNRPSWRGFDRALEHAGHELGRDGKVWVRWSWAYTAAVFVVSGVVGVAAQAASGS